MRADGHVSLWAPGKARGRWFVRWPLIVGLLIAAVVVLAAPPAALASCPAGSFANGQVCEEDFSFTGSPATFTVPADVASVHIQLQGAAGGGGDGGMGGEESGTLPVTQGEELTIVVGGQGASPLSTGNVCLTAHPGGEGGYGGGGAGGGANYPTCAVPAGGGGGGGSFVFGANDSLLLAAGGGGGSGGAIGPPSGFCGGQGGAGSGATGGTAGFAYGCDPVSGEVGQGGGGASTGGGQGGAPFDGVADGITHFGDNWDPCGATTTAGDAGLGPASSDTVPGLGGVGGTAAASPGCPNGWAGVGAGGGGGGGGYFGGGGGGGSLPAASGGGGGSGFAASSVSNASSQTGVSFGDGSATLTFTPSCPVFTGSGFTGARAFTGLTTPTASGACLSVSIADAAAVYEPARGSGSASFTLSLSETSDSPVSVHYQTKDGTGPAGATTAANDYTATQGTALFSPGQTSKQISVPIDAGSGRSRTASKHFSVALSSPHGATLNPSAVVATGTIGVPRVFGQVTGFRDSKQVGISDVEIDLKGRADTGQAVTRTATTGDSGRYQLYADPGSYTVTVKPPSDARQDVVAPGNCDGSASQDHTGLSHCKLVLGPGHENEEASFLVPAPEIEPLVGGDIPRCVATNAEPAVVFKPGDCKHPALLDSPITIKGTGFAANQTVKLRWFHADENDPRGGSVGPSFKSFTVKTDSKGRFVREIQTDWLNGTCQTRLVAHQLQSVDAETLVPFDPEYLVYTNGVRIAGHDFHGGFLCADAHHTFWPTQLRDAVNAGDYAFAQTINHSFATVSPPVDGAVGTTGPGLDLYLFSIAPGGQEIDCDCVVQAQELQVERPDGRFFTLHSRSTIDGAAVWSFGGVPLVHPQPKLAHCTQHPEFHGPAVFQQHWSPNHGIGAEACDQFARGVLFKGGLGLPSFGRVGQRIQAETVYANSQIRVKHGLTAAENTGLFANAGLIIVQGGMHGFNTQLGADQLVKLGY